MSRFSSENVLVAEEIIDRYPRDKSALIPLLHLAQQQDGYVSNSAMEHIAELTGITPAEVLGTCSFYEMFKLEPVGKYLINVCTNISCLLDGGEELLEHAEEVLGVKSGGTTEDSMFTVEEVECIAACTEAPCIQINYRYFPRLKLEDFDLLIEDIRSGKLDLPSHGSLSPVRQLIPSDSRDNIKSPDDVSAAPVWFSRRADKDQVK